MIFVQLQDFSILVLKSEWHSRNWKIYFHRTVRSQSSCMVRIYQCCIKSSLFFSEGTINSNKFKCACHWTSTKKKTLFLFKESTKVLYSSGLICQHRITLNRQHIGFQQIRWNLSTKTPILLTPFPTASYWAVLSNWETNTKRNPLKFCNKLWWSQETRHVG